MELWEFIEENNLKYSRDETNINLSGLNISSLNGIEKYRKLKYLYIRNCELEDLRGIEYCKDIIFLDVSSNKLTDLNNIPPNVEYLCCGDNEIKELNFVNKELKYFNCEHNYIEDLSLLYQCNKLMQIMVNNNLINEFLPHKNVKYYDLENNDIDNIKDIKKCIKLKTLNISECDVSVEILNDVLSHLIISEFLVEDKNKLFKIINEHINLKNVNGDNKNKFLNKLKISILNDYYESGSDITD